SAPFCGNSVAIERSSGPPGKGSLIVVSASAVTGERVSVAAPAVPRNIRREISREEENALCMCGAPTELCLDTASSALSRSAPNDFVTIAMVGAILRHFRSRRPVIQKPSASSGLAIEDNYSGIAKDRQAPGASQRRPP